MKGVILPRPAGPLEVVSNIPKPSPGPHEILVKSLVAGLNPLDNLMVQTGILVDAWPIVLGCDASGVVTEIGKDVTRVKVGDRVFGPVRVGFVGYMTFQEFFLMEERYAFLTPDNLSAEQAATSPIASLTASLGLVSGLGLKIPEPGAVKKEKDEWIVILGGAASIGQMSIQLAKLNGYKVLASCSPSNNELVKSFGADATLDYKKSLPDQLSEIQTITQGNFSKLFDPSAASYNTAVEALSKISTVNKKLFASTDNWTPWQDSTGFATYRIDLGQLGRSGNPIAEATDRDVTSFIPKLQKLFASGDLKPLNYQIGGEGFEGVLEGLKLLASGKVKGKKIVVRLQDA